MKDTTNNSARARLQPIRDEDLAAVCSFYHTYLNRHISVADWKNAFLQPWMDDKPNNGFMLVDDGRVVGTFGAIYAERKINGKQIRLLNQTSWSVLPPYRRQSLELLSATLAQSGYHITSFTPNPDVLEICQYMGFTLLDPKLAIFPNLPHLSFGRSRGRILTDPEQALTRLPPLAAQDFANHRSFPWFEQLALGSDDGPWCHVLFKRKIWKKLPCAVILHLSDPEIFLQWVSLLGHHLLLRRGIASTQVPLRYLPRPPKGSWIIEDTQPRMVISPELSAMELTALYTEMLVLDLPL